MSSSSEDKRQPLPSTIPSYTPETFAHNAKSRVRFEQGQPSTATVSQPSQSLVVPPPRLASPRSVYPPTSFRSSQTNPNISTSHLPYRERSEDLSGTKNQLRLRNYSIQTLQDPDAIAGSIPQKPLPKTPGLLKSRTMVSLEATETQTTPRYRLMQPLGPPMPRSQTLGDISKMVTPRRISYPKTSSIPRATSSRRIESRDTVSVIDALLESRMTDREIELLNKVQKEATINQQRLRRMHVETFFPSLSTADNSIFNGVQQNPSTRVDLHLSSNDVVNKQKLEQQRGRTVVARPWFVNSALVQAESKALPVLPSLVDPDSGLQAAWDGDIKLVYFFEETPYWIGRFLTFRDRLRMQALSNIQDNTHLGTERSSVPPDSFEKTEEDRIELTLSELRKCCRTAEALEGFEKFEKGITAKNQSMPHTSYILSALRSEGMRSSARQVSKESGSGSQLPITSNTGGYTASSIPGEPATSAPHYTMSSSSALPRPSLVKSKTTGNLTEVMAWSKLRSQPTSTNVQTNHERSIKSGQDALSAARIDAWREREIRAAARAATAQRKGSGRASPQIDGSKPATGSQGSQCGPGPMSGKSRIVKSTTISKATEFEEIADGLTCAVLESGHGFPPPTSSQRTRRPSTKVCFDDTIRADHAKSTSMSTGRKSSTQLLRNFVGAGVKNAKRLGRQVSGSMSWLNDNNESTTKRD